MKWLYALLIAALLLPLASTGVEAQDEGAEEPSVAAGDEPAEGDESFDEMESILRVEEEMIQGDYAYDAGRRRDPFISLLRKRNAPVARPEGDCPIGCLIDEVTLTGIFLMPEGPVAQVQSPDQEKSFLIRVGDEFHDGDVIAITADSVRFRQMVNDFQEMKPFREVTKKLNP